MEPARGKSCDSGQRRGPADPGKDKFPSPDQKSFNMRTIATNRGREWRSPGSIPLRRGWKPQPHWVVVDWLKLMQAARGESCPSGQRRHPAALKEDQVLSPDENSFHTPTTPTNRGRQHWSPRSILHRAVRKSKPHWVIVDWLKLMEPARGESCLRPLSTSRRTQDQVLSQDDKSLDTSTTPSTRERKHRSARPIPPRAVRKPQTHWVIVD